MWEKLHFGELVWKNVNFSRLVLENMDFGGTMWIFVGKDDFFTGEDGTW